ncbi:hypothetical protein Tco_0194720 [Tanacetum coccineum]
MACKSLMLALGQSGMRPCYVKKAVNVMKPPYVADVTSKQCYDILSEQRKQYKSKEFYGLIKHFQDKASYDKVVNSGRAAEEDEDFKTMNPMAVLSSVHPIEAKADQISRKKAKESEDVFEDNSVGASQVDMMPQICVRDPTVKTKTKRRPKIATRVKSPIELFLYAYLFVGQLDGGSWDGWDVRLSLAGFGGGGEMKKKM